MILIRDLYDMIFNNKYDPLLYNSKNYNHRLDTVFIYYLNYLFSTKCYLKLLLYWLILE